MKLTVKKGRDNIQSISIDEEEIERKMEKLKEKHLCTDCYAQKCKLEGITVGKPRVLKGYETQHQVVILECRDYHVFSFSEPKQSLQEDKKTQIERDLIHYATPTAKIIHPEVARAINQMK